jgi:hypothetical protein
MSGHTAPGQQLMSDAQAGYTPGPWSVAADRTESRHARFVGSNGLNGGIWIAETKGPHCAGNARLIAAAPELLEALRNMADNVHRLAGYLKREGYAKAAMQCQVGVDDARIVIAKALPADGPAEGQEHAEPRSAV